MSLAGVIAQVWVLYVSDDEDALIGVFPLHLWRHDLDPSSGQHLRWSVEPAEWGFGQSVRLTYQLGAGVGVDSNSRLGGIHDGRIWEKKEMINTIIKKQLGVCNNIWYSWRNEDDSGDFKGKLTHVYI